MLSIPLEWVLPVFAVDATLAFELMLPLELTLPVRRGCRMGPSPPTPPRFDLSLFLRLLRWELPVDVDCMPVCSLLLLVLVLLPLAGFGVGVLKDRRGEDRELVFSLTGTEWSPSS